MFLNSIFSYNLKGRHPQNIQSPVLSHTYIRYIIVINKNNLYIDLSGDELQVWQRGAGVDTSRGGLWRDARGHFCQPNSRHVWRVPQARAQKHSNGRANTKPTQTLRFIKTHKYVVF